MHKLFRGFVFAVAVTGLAASASAGELTVKIANGRATVIAKDVTLRQILAEWARVGSTRIVNAEKLVGGPINLELVDLPEKDVLDTLLRTAAGYLTGPRPAGSPGASLYDRVMILATSRPPVNTVSAPPTAFGNRPAFNQLPVQPPPDDDDGEPGDQGPVPPPGMQPGTQQFPGAPRTVPMPGPNPGINVIDPNNPNANPNANPAVNPNAPVTAPRPGMLPQPQQMPINPYSPMGRPNNPNNPNGRGGGGDDQEGAV